MTCAVIFDMDGVISDTQKLHAAEESRVLAKHGIMISPGEISRRYAGVDTASFFRDLFVQAGLATDGVDDIVAGIKDRMHALDPREIVAVDGVRNLIDELLLDEWRLAVASSASRVFIKTVLDALQMQDKFGAIASAQDVERGKPAPDVFLLAAKRLGVDPRDCVVIEDGVAGMRGAAAAGMKCVALVPEPGEYPAQAQVTSLRELSSYSLGQLIGR